MSQVPSQRLPPLESSGLFSLSASTIIDAPIDHVWRVLVDFKSYREWNPFTRTHSVVDSSGRTLSDDAIAEGLFVDCPEVHIPPTMGKSGWFGKVSAFETVVSFDRTNHRFGWEYSGAMPRWLIRAERWQILTDEGNGRTMYFTFEVFGGLLAYLVLFFQKNDLAAGFQAMADSLKVRSESTLAK